MNAAEIDTDRLVSDLKSVTKEAEELLKTVAGEEGDGSREVHRRLSAAIESAKATYRRLQEQAVEGAQATDRVIRAHPYESLGIAFGVGLLVGLLVARK
jgi:ElaB/YqjD/DUF883 family membrane-anchored ribosome-binding protein